MRTIALTAASSLFILTLSSCAPDSADRDYRQDMRDFVVRIAEQARAADADFIVIPQNGQELLTENGEPDGPVAADYVQAVDGQGREDLFYGYNEDNVPTPAADRDYLLGFLARAEAEGVQVLATDYCETPAFVTDSYNQSRARGFISFAANRRELDVIPPLPLTPEGANNADVATLADAKNFLYFINPGSFATREAFVAAVDTTNYDVILLDAFFEDQALSADEVTALKTKANGGARLVIAYMSIGEAEDYRDYWQAGWTPGSPDWVEEENADFPGNFKVQYWRQEWQALILDGPDAYLTKLLNAGFDGVYLDLIDAFEYFEQ